MKMNNKSQRENRQGEYLDIFITLHKTRSLGFWVFFFQFLTDKKSQDDQKLSLL